MSGLRFCPFCKEPFEGDLCPDHGLPLVSLVDLASVRRVPAESDPLRWTDLRFGRGQMLLGALLVVVGFFVPAVVDGTRDGAATSAFDIWLLRADYLGIVPAVVVGIAGLAFARRTRLDLMRARPAFAFALTMASAALLLAASRVVAYSNHLDSIGAENEIDPAFGAFAMCIGIAIQFASIVRLGRAP